MDKPAATKAWSATWSSNVSVKSIIPQDQKRLAEKQPFLCRAASLYNPEASRVLTNIQAFFASPWTPRAQIKQMTQIRHRCYRTSNTGALTVRIIVVVVLPTISVRRGEWPYEPIVNIAPGVRATTSAMTCSGLPFCRVVVTS